MNAPRLAPLQRRFLELISQPHPLLEAARDRADLAGALPLAAWLQEPDAAALAPPLPSEELLASRLGIYAHMYFARLRDSLREDYPRSFELVGRERFDRIAVGYLLRHPSDHPSLRYHGRRFASFLRAPSASGDFAELRVDLAALAALEWARIEVFDAADRRSLLSAAFARLSSTDLHACPLRSVPSFQLLQTEFAVTGLWQALALGAAPPEPRLASEHVLVWRRGFAVYHRAVEAPEASALRQLQCGTTLTELGAACAVGDESLDTTSRRLFGWLRQWMADELIADPGSA